MHYLEYHLVLFLENYCDCLHIGKNFLDLNPINDNSQVTEKPVRAV